MVPPSFAATASAAASCLRAIGRTRQARVRPSPSRVRGGLAAVARLSGAADGGVLLTVSAERRVYHRRTGSRLSDGQRARSRVTRRPPSGRSSIFGAVALERRDRGADVEAGGVRGAEDELAGLAQAERHAVDAVDARERLAEAGDGAEAAEALDDDLGRGRLGRARCAAAAAARRAQRRVELGQAGGEDLLLGRMDLRGGRRDAVRARTSTARPGGVSATAVAASVGGFRAARRWRSRSVAVGVAARGAGGELRRLRHALGRGGESGGIVDLARAARGRRRARARTRSRGRAGPSSRPRCGARRRRAAGRAGRGARRRAARPRA